MPVPKAEIKPVIVTKRRANQSPLLLIAFTWALFTAALIGTNLIANINWATPRMEQEVSKITNRHVTLGMVSWRMGWDGLYVATDRCIVNEKNGTPFMISGPSEIGVSTFDLLRGKIVIRRFSFKEPEFWAVEIEPGKWNFEDLITVLEQVSSLHVENGKLHLVHRAAFLEAHRLKAQTSKYAGIRIARRWANRWRKAHMTQDSEDIFVDVVKPERDKDWPLTLAFSVPEDGYKTHVSMNVVGHGLLRDWKQNRYRVELGADNVNAAELQLFAPTFAGLKGRFQVRATADGIYERGGYSIMANAHATDITFPTPGYGPITLTNSGAVAELLVDPNAVQIRRMNMRSSSFYANISGLVRKWRTTNPGYNLHVASRIYDLGELAKVIPAKIFPPGFVAEAKGNHLSLAQLLEPARLTGQGSAIITIGGTGERPTLIGDIDVSGISTGELFENGPLKRFSMISLLSNEPVRVKTSINMLDGRNIVSLSQVFAGDSVITANATFPLHGHGGAMNFVANDLDLANMARNLANNPSALEQLYKYIWLPGGTSLSLGGEADVWGSLANTRSGLKALAVLRLRNAVAEISDGSLTAQHVNGQARLINNAVIVDKLTGHFGKGPFELSGMTNLKNRFIDVRVHAQNTQMVHAKRLMQVLKIDEPMLQLIGGQVREVFLAVKGTPKDPKIAMTAVPERIVLHVPYSTQSIVVTGGTVKADDHAVAFSNVRGSLGRGSFVLNGGALMKPSLAYNIMLSARDADLDDTNKLLGALRINVPLLRTLTGTVRSANVHISGPGSNPVIAMVSNPSSVYIPLVNTKHRIHVTGGVVRYDPRGLSFGNVVGTLGGGNFKLNGKVQLSPSARYDINLVAHNADLADTQHLLETLHISEPLLVGMSGTVRDVRLSIKGVPENPEIAMNATPKSIYARVPGTNHVVHVTGGEIALDAGVVTFKNTTGDLAGNKFTISGTATLPPTQVFDVHITTGRVNLADAQKILAAMKINVPMLNFVNLSGTIASADIRVRGSLASPQITLNVVPESLAFETKDQQHKLRLAAGDVSLQNDTLVVKNLSITGTRSRLVADLIVEHISTNPHLKLLRADTPGFDLADLSFFLSSPGMPDILKAVLDAYQIRGWHGIIAGNVNIEDRGGAYNFAGDLNLSNVGGTLAINDKPYRIHDINGRVAGNGPADGIATISGGIGHSSFTINAHSGSAGALPGTMPVWTGLVTAQIDPVEYLDAIPIQPAYVAWKLADRKPIPAEAKFTLTLGSPGSFRVDSGQIALGDYAIKTSGEYRWYGKNSKQEPTVAFDFSLSRPLQLAQLAELAQIKDVPAITGSVNGVVRLEGPVSKIIADGYLALCDVGLPDYQITGITGKVVPIDIKAPNSNTGPFKLAANLELNSMRVRGLMVNEIRGDLIVSRTRAGGPLTLLVQDANMRTADGVVTADVSVAMSKPLRFSVIANLKGLDASDLAEGLFDEGDEIEGRLSGQTTLCGSGTTRTELIRSLNGSGRITVAQGKVKELGQLQWKLGLLGALKRFDIGTLLTSLVPPLGSKFDRLTAAFSINRGIVCVPDFRFCGPGLRLAGTGSIDLLCEDIHMRMAGEITKGDIAFSFNIDAPMSDSKAIADSIKDTVAFEPKGDEPPYPVATLPPDAVPPSSCPAPREPEELAAEQTGRSTVTSQVSISPDNNISRAFARFRQATHLMAEQIRNSSASPAVPTKMTNVLPTAIPIH